MAVQCIFNLAEERTYQDREIIYREGSPGDWVYFILSGSVEIFKYFEGRNFLITVLQPGEIFGELAFIGASKRTASARALGETTVGVIDRALQEREFNQLSTQFRKILDTIAKRSVNTLHRACAFQKRAETRLPKVLSLSYKNPEVFLNAYTSNVSSGGLFIKTDKPLSPGHEFQLKLTVPGLSNPLNIGCEVIWARKREESLPDLQPGMGIKFVDMSEKDSKLLQKVITSLKKKSMATSHPGEYPGESMFQR